MLLQQRKRIAKAEVEIDLSRDLAVTADPQMFRQVMLNILLNAFQALPEKTGQIKISGANSGPEVRLRIEDNGVGMDEDVLKKIFDPFFTTKPNGTGLGLSIVHRTVTELGGQISVESEPGRGTAFQLVFPKNC